MPTKKELLSALRRKDIHLARRVRAFDNTLASFLFDAHSDSLKDRKNNTSGLIHTLRKHQSFLYPLLSNEQKTDIEQMFPRLFALNDIDVLHVETPEQLDRELFVKATSSQPTNKKPIFTILDKLAYLEMQENKEVGRYYKKLCTEELISLSSKLSTLKKDVSEKLGIFSSHASQLSAFLIPEKYANSIDPELCGYLFSLPEKHDIVMLNDTITPNGLEIISSTIPNSELATDSIKISNNNNNNNNIFTVDFASSSEDSRGVFHNTPQLFIDAMAKNWNKTIKRKQQEFYVLDKAAMNDISKVHKFADVSSQASVNKYLIKLSPESTWFIKNGDHMTCRQIGALENEDVSLFMTPDSDLHINIPGHAISEIKESSQPIFLEVSLDNDLNWQVDRFVNENTITTLSTLPDTRRERLVDAKKYIKQFNEQGYIDKRYMSDEISGITKKQGISLVEFTNSLSHLLELNETESFFDIDIRTRKDSKSPYFASFTVYSIQADKPYIRRIASCISDPASPYLDEQSLNELGMTQSQFDDNALTLSEAEQLLTKPINQVKTKGLLSFPSLNNNELDHFPLLSLKTRRWPALNRRALSKELGLTKRQDHVLTLKTEKNNTNGFSFLCEEGGELSLLSKLKQDNSTIWSECGLGVIRTLSEKAFFYDVQENVKIDLGPTDELLRIAETHAHKPHKQSNPSGDLELINHHILQRALLASNIHKLNKLPPNMEINIENSTLSKEWKEGVKERARELYSATLEKIPRYLCVEGMHNYLCETFEKEGFDLTSPIAGGVGGSKGKEFLRSLQSQSPTLFTAVTRECKIELDTALEKGSPQRIDKALASVTLSDILLMNVIELHKANPELAEHFQLIHAAPAFFDEVEPTTNTAPHEKLNEYSLKSGVSTQMLDVLYESAVNFKTHNNQSYKSFLAQKGDLTPLGDGSVQSVSAMLGSLRIQYPNPQHWAQHLTKHVNNTTLQKNIAIHINDTSEPNLLDINIDNSTRRLSLSSPVELDDHIVEELRYTLNLLKIANGAHNIFTRSNLRSDPNILEEQHTLLLNQLYSPENKERLNALNERLIESGLETIRKSHTTGELQRWLQNIGTSLINEGVTSRPFNSHFDQETLNISLGELKKILHTHEMNFHQLDDTIENIEKEATLEFEIHQTIVDYLTKSPTLVADNKLSSKRRMAKQFSLAHGDNVKEVSYADITKHLVKSVSLPSKTKDALVISAVGGFDKLPSESLAKRIFKHMREISNNPILSFPLYQGPVGDLQKTFLESTHAPLLGAVNLITSFKSRLKKPTIEMTHTPEKMGVKANKSP